MNGIKKALYSYIFPACLYYTIISVILSAIASTTNNIGYAPSLVTLLCIFVFSLAITIVNKVYTLKNLNLGLRVIIHYALTVVAFFLSFFVFTGNYQNGAGALIIILIYTIVYFIIAGIVLALRKLVRRDNNDSQKYTSQFKK